MKRCGYAPMELLWPFISLPGVRHTEFMEFGDEDSNAISDNAPLWAPPTNVELWLETLKFSGCGVSVEALERTIRASPRLKTLNFDHEASPGAMDTIFPESFIDPPALMQHILLRVDALEHLQLADASWPDIDRREGFPSDVRKHALPKIYVLTSGMDHFAPLAS